VRVSQNAQFLNIWAILLGLIENNDFIDAC